MEDPDDLLRELRERPPSADLNPAFLLADSRPLFARLGEGSVSELVAAAYRDAAWIWGPRAAYLGACNGDRPEFYEIFESFAEAARCPQRMHVRAEPTEAERDFLAEADLIVLGGGDPLQGLRAFESAGLVEVLRESFTRGAVLVGVSAGATLLGLGTRDAAERFAPTLGLVPLVIETGPDAAERLAASVQQAPIPRGVAIPAGGAAAFHPDGSLEPLASTLEEIVSEEDGGLRRAHLLPSAAGGGDERPVH
ncbi:MAG: Type 1 glutamine amidotransferase-like domain-containing protein [Sandaracinaceae bacterium]